MHKKVSELLKKSIDKTVKLTDGQEVILRTVDQKTDTCGISTEVINYDRHGIAPGEKFSSVVTRTVHWSAIIIPGKIRNNEGVR